MMPPVKEPLAGLALLVIFGFLIWYNRPIDNPRLFDPYPQHQVPRPIGQGDTYEAWLWKDPFGFDSSPDQKSQGQTCQASLEKILKKKPVILAPLVKVRPDTVENKEIRTRHRYAVVAGLIETGYRPQEPDRLHFCTIQKDSREYDMRWEHYRYESKDNSKGDKPDIVVAWIDSEILTAENKLPAGHRCTHSCNFAFKNLLKELSKNNKFYLFDLNDILGHDRSEQIKDHIKCINEKNKCDKKENIKLIKPAGMEGETGNEELAGKLARELELRDIKDSSGVVIIMEQGSENAARLASNVRQSLGKSFATPGEIRNVFYLKSSDGNPKKTGNQDKKDKNENQAANQADHGSVIDLHRSTPRPVGPSQLDYFHRLAEEIKNVHDTVDIAKRDSGAKAVVILGSDFNDKLLIIEALREKIPHLLILTTNLDAQMLYPQHWRSTRNLVVASHFNLLLRKKPKDDKTKNDKTPFWQRSYQDQFPPFRDSQQTNIFYRTLSIAAGDASGIEQSKITFPRIFEVGRNGFVRLGTAEKNNNLDYHPPNTQENTAKQLGLLFVIAVSLIGFHWAIRPRSKLLSFYLFLSTLTIFAIAFFLGTDFFSPNESKEPLSFIDSVSLWPTLFIQIITIFLAGGFFVQAMCELEESFCRLSGRYFSDNRSHFPACPGECELWARIRWHSLGPWLEGLRGNRWIPFAVLIVAIIAYTWNDVSPSELPLWLCLVILAVLTAIYLIKIEPKDNISIKHWMEAASWNPSGQVNHESDLWKQYYDHGQFGPRIARVVWIWLIFAIIETLLVYLLPPWPLPWRGATDWASWIEMAPWTGVLSFTVAMLLLFFILDAVRLNFSWIKKLRTQHPLLNVQPPGFLADTERRSRLASLENMVSQVAERTRVVDKLIYYPMLCIMLILFAKIAYFDNQEFPLSKGITFGAAFSFLFLSGFMLRREANELKLSVKKSVRDIRVNSNHEELDETVRRIDAIDEGAFQSMFEQPVMQALLIILASIGLFAGEYLKLFG